MKYLKIIISLILILLLYYFMLPPINLSDPSFWAFVFISVVMICIVSLIVSSTEILKVVINNKKVNKKSYILFSALFIIFGLIIIFNVANSPLFMAKSYYNRISVNNSDFTTDVEPVDFDKLPLLDKDSSIIRR